MESPITPLSDQPTPKRYIDHKCMLCYTNFVSRQPLVNMPLSKYKKGNYMCKKCRMDCKSRVFKCDGCKRAATNFLILECDSGYPYVGKFCSRCV